ncbi:Ig-like domain-containing protein, partial [Psychromonas sp. SR45-3]|uniref:Ig-like domain-containing protein n=1 Tax=Psychromonas sp. SR45-3 TaxID=2760930 RepID=UPI0015F832C7
FNTSDEDGNDVTVTVDDIINYQVVGNEVLLTAAGAALVNSGAALPEFTLTPNDGTINGETDSATPVVNTVNDAPTVEITSVINVTEDAAETVAGLVVATFETNDEDGDTVTVALSDADSENYAIVDGTIVLTAAGADLANRGEELPAFTLTPSDQDVSGESVSADPSVILTNDDETVVNNDSAVTDEDMSVVIDVLANDTDSDVDGIKSPIVSVSEPSNGTVVFNNDGEVIYTPNANFNGTDSFTYTNAEGQEGTVNVTITPQDDPTIIQVAGSNSAEGRVLEDGGSLQSAQGTFIFSDPDYSELDTYQPTSEFTSSTGGSNAIGNFTLTPTPTASNPGQFQWEYVLNNEAAQYLDIGQNITEIYTVSINGVTTEVPITIFGAEDPTEIIVNAGAGDSAIGEITEDNDINGKLTTSGKLTFSDVDTIDSENFDPQVNLTNTTGTAQLGLLTINPDGTWNYEVDNTNSEIQALDSNETITETHTVNLNGTTQDIVITINGVDEPLSVNDNAFKVDDSGIIIKGLSGEYWGYNERAEGGQLKNIATVNNYTAEQAAEVTFVSTEMNYRKFSGDLADDVDASGIPSHLTNFLGSDSSSIVAVDGGSTEGASAGIIKLSGNLDVETAGVYQFTVRHDDGFQVIVDGNEAIAFDGNTGPRNTTQEITLAAGLHSVDIIYWDQGGDYVLELDLSQVISGNGTNSIFGDNIWISENLSHAIDESSTEINTSITLDLLSNDIGEGITIHSVGAATYGLVAIENGNVIYTPNTNYTGADSFTYTIIDENGIVSNEATANVSVVHNQASGLIEGLVYEAEAVSGQPVTSVQASSVAVEPADDNQTLIGDWKQNTLIGGSGDDHISGLSNQDTLHGEGGDDFLFGGSGRDQLFGGTGNDTLEGNDENDQLSGGAGNDELLGGTGNDLLEGDTGHDILKGGDNNDQLYGGDGDDVLFGGDNGRDELYGGAGGDLLIGGTGNDILAGGDGNDTFVWTASDTYGTDTITDFNINEDKLDLSDLLQGESENTLGDYLDFSFDGKDTTITTYKEGGDSPTQKIVLEDTQLEGIDTGGLDSLGNVSDTDKEIVINNLLNDGALIIGDTIVENTSSPLDDEIV